MRFVDFKNVADLFHGKYVAIVGSAPSVLENTKGYVDSHDVVVRVNNYKLGPRQGFRADVHYSFYGSSIRKKSAELIADGVKLCMCKCPDGKPIECTWHEANNRQNGIDFTYIYRARKDWWFCDTYVPTIESFLRGFNLLGMHIPTTGFAAILDVLACGPERVYLTGFDFFASGKHNVNEPWRPGNPLDPIGHVPQAEAKWVKDNAANYPMRFDPKLGAVLHG